MSRSMVQKLLGGYRRKARCQIGRAGRRLIVESLEQRALLTAGVAPSSAILSQDTENSSAVTAPVAPSFKATAVSGTQIKLSWGSVSRASGYLVDEWISSAWKQIGSFGSGTTSHTVGGLSPGTTYYFDVAAYNAAGTSWANFQSVSTLSPPAAPSLKAAVVSGTQVKLSWNKVSGASGYLVDKWVGGVWKQIGSFGSSTTSDTVSGLSSGTTYYFTVGAYNAGGVSWSNSQGVTPLSPPAAPSLKATPVSSTQVNLAWNTVSGASGYLVDEWINGAWKQIGIFGSGTTSDPVSGLSPATTYYFDVGAYNSVGTSWAKSQGATTRKAPPPAAPSFRVIAVSSTQINVSWNTVSGASGYLVDEWINGAWKQIGNFGSGTTSDPVTGLHSATTYYFDVGAYNSGGTSWAKSQSATTANSSGNWSGYVIVPGSKVNEVSATWVEPTVSSTQSGSKMSIWVGIDGSNGSNTVEQIGTTWSASTGWYAWFEFYGDGLKNSSGQWIAKGAYFYETPINSYAGYQVFKIQPGDTITADVTYELNSPTTSEFFLALSDKSATGQASGWTALLTTEYLIPARTTGEWIVEAPSNNSGILPLANFGTVNFSGAWATAGGITGPITDFTNHAIDMVQTAAVGGNMDYTSAILNSSTPGLYEPSDDTSSSFYVRFGSLNSTASQSSNTPSASLAAPVGGPVTTAQLDTNSTSVESGSTPISSPLNVDVVAVDRILGTLDVLDSDSDAAALGRPEKDNRAGTNLAPTVGLNLSLVDNWVGYSPYRAS